MATQHIVLPVWFGLVRLRISSVILIAAFLDGFSEYKRACEGAAGAENRLPSAVAPVKILGGAGSRNDRPDGWVGWLSPQLMRVIESAFSGVKLGIIDSNLVDVRSHARSSQSRDRPSRASDGCSDFGIQGRAVIRHPRPR